MMYFVKGFRKVNEACIKGFSLFLNICVMVENSILGTRLVQTRQGRRARAKNLVSGDETKPAIVLEPDPRKIFEELRNVSPPTRPGYVCEVTRVPQPQH